MASVVWAFQLWSQRLMNWWTQHHHGFESFPFSFIPMVVDKSAHFKIHEHLDFGFHDWFCLATLCSSRNIRIVFWYSGITHHLALCIGEDFGSQIPEWQYLANPQTTNPTKVTTGAPCNHPRETFPIGKVAPPQGLLYHPCWHQRNPPSL